MPNRILREGILASERVAQLGWPEEVFYRRLMSIVDDYGRHESIPQLLRAKCYPLQTDAVRVTDISRWMAACQKAGLILCYEANGKQYLAVLDFNQQQRTPSKHPGPQATDSNCNQLLANAHLDGGVVVDEGDKAPPAADLFAGVDPQVARDFTAMRTAKRAKVTATAIAGIRREAESAGLTLESALRICCERGWQGFKADWMTKGCNPGNREPARLPDLTS